MRHHRNIDEIEGEYLREHPEEIEDYLRICFEEYNNDGDTGALLSSLRVISQVKGVAATAQAAGLTRNGLQKALSEQGNPSFENINAIMHALGYQLIPQPWEHQGG